MQTPRTINNFEDRDPESVDDVPLLNAKKACQSVTGPRLQSFSGFAYGGFSTPLEMGGATTHWARQKSATWSIELDRPVDNIKEAADGYV